MNRITIVTPTRNRPLPILEGCLRSVEQQTCSDWLHLVCSDGQRESGVEELVRRKGDARRQYLHTPSVTGHFGAGVRAALLPGIQSEYVAFLDDDNLLFPRFCERMFQALDTHPEAGFAICQIVHFGPLPPHFGLPPAILTGIPPVTNNIDTLQVVARTAAMQVCGWVLDGYGSDVATYGRLGSLFPWMEVPEVLAIHL